MPEDFDVQKFLNSRKRWEDFIEALMDSDPKCKGYRMAYRKALWILSNGRISIPSNLVDLYMQMPAPETITRAMRKVKEHRPDLRLPKESHIKRRFLATLLKAYYSNKQTKLGGWNA